MILKNIYRFSTKNPKLYVFGGQGTHEKGMLEPLIKNEESLKLVREMSESIGVDFEEIGTTDRDNKINKT